MFQHNLLITFRNFRKFKGSFLINLTGLSTGLACALLIYLWVTDELGMDKFHEKDSRLYQVLKTFPQADGTIRTMEYTPALMAEMMADELPEVEHSTSIIQRDKGIISAGDKFVKAKHLFASEDYFNVFSYQLIQGNKEKALSEKYGVLLSEDLALKLFNTTENITGRMIEWEWWERFGGTYTVSGVFQTPPVNSSRQFDLIFSHALWIEKNGWDSYWGSNNANTFLVLKEGTNALEFSEKIRDYSRAKYKKLHGKEDLRWEGDIFLQRYSDRYLYNRIENGAVAGGRIEYVKLFSVIAIFILAIACINFMNLSTAKASRRIKEVGIKKAVGAQRGALIGQYLGESLLLTFLAMIVAVLLAYLLLPPFREITGKGVTLSFDSNLLLTAAGIMLVTGLISGSYPALYLSGFSPAMVLKGQLKTSSVESWVRKGLVVFQFSISILLIVSVIVVYKQIEFIQTKNLGYNKDNIIKFSNEGKLGRNLTTFLTEVKKLPGVVNASNMGGDLVGNHGGGGGIVWEGKNNDEGIEFSGLYVDHDLIETLGLEMAEGRTFSRQLDTDREKVIFNETAIAMMRLKDPVGRTVTLWGKEKQIVGIVKDFHYESFYKNVGPFFFSCTENNPNTLIKVAAGMETETLAGVQKLYQEFNPGLSFDYTFLDQDYQTLYAAENRVAILSRYFAGVAILISCLGLFGLASFTIEKRSKEISIRKVLGSTELGIVYLISSDFTKMVLASIVLTLPMSFLIASNWLDNFAYKIDLEWWYFIGTGLMALFIAWITVGLQTVKAALANPVTSLRSE